MYDSAAPGSPAYESPAPGSPAYDIPLDAAPGRPRAPRSDPAQPGHQGPQPYATPAAAAPRTADPYPRPSPDRYPQPVPDAYTGLPGDPGPWPSSDPYGRPQEAARQGPLPARDSGMPGGAAWQRHDPWSTPDAGADLPADGAAYPARPRRLRGLSAALLFALVTGVLGGAVGAYLEHRDGDADTVLPQEARNDAGRAPTSVAGIAASALPGVVTLHVSGKDEAGTGTGFVLDRQGHILTNNHVVALAGSGGEISVTFGNGRTADAKLVGKDGGYDLAVVQVKGITGLKPLELGNSDNVRVGDPVVAIGAPFDLSNTVTSGIISAKDRPITAGGESSAAGDVSYVDALQTDAPINPGNSGGPLVDAHARVIGINSAIRAADSGTSGDGAQAGSIGLGFAIPVNQAKRVAEELISTGKATHPVIGVTLDTGYQGDGARVGAKAADGGPAVEAGGPAARAGIRSGDLITAVDGEAVHSDQELIVKIRAHRPGDRLTLTVRRAGTARTARLTLGSAEGM
ncbi:trypsin-like peptidase domain-containing protein [Streptomyces sp. NBC_01497]|uniref:S1C family serine protease n=1 Tax=Streptomyces sp. NBC_01497 TaxID=2903885 RepID=UPI003FCCAB6A